MKKIERSKYDAATFVLCSFTYRIYMVDMSANAFMYTSAFDGRFDGVHMAIAYGATAWQDGLMAAIYGGHCEIARFMLSRGARATGETVRAAARSGRADVLEMLKQYTCINWNDALYYGASSGHENVCRVCGENGADDWTMALFAAACVDAPTSVMDYLWSMRNADQKNTLPDSDTMGASSNDGVSV
jgi:hypothetical protein